jgi:hypothetical protein
MRDAAGSPVHQPVEIAAIDAVVVDRVQVSLRSLVSHLVERATDDETRAIAPVRDGTMGSRAFGRALCRPFVHVEKSRAYPRRARAVVMSGCESKESHADM